MAAGGPLGSGAPSAPPAPPPGQASLPPTAATLRELADNDDVTGILSRRVRIVPRLPRVIVENGKVRLTMSTPGEESA